jgi:hypothetical protein
LEFLWTPASLWNWEVGIMNTTRMSTVLFLAGGVLVATAGCAGAQYPIEVTGNTGLCQEHSTVWSGEPLGDVLPGSVLDRQITCPQNAMSDDRVTGAFEGSIHCVFGERLGSYVGDCTSEYTLANDGGTWHQDAGNVSITVVPGEASRIVEDGVYVGKGQYQGLRYVIHVESDPAGYPWPVTGTIERSD